MELYRTEYWYIKCDDDGKEEIAGYYAVDCQYDQSELKEWLLSQVVKGKTFAEIADTDLYDYVNIGEYSVEEFFQDTIAELEEDAMSLILGEPCDIKPVSYREFLIRHLKDLKLYI